MVDHSSAMRASCCEICCAKVRFWASTPLTPPTGEAGDLDRAELVALPAHNGMHDPPILSVSSDESRMRRRLRLVAALVW